jgi:hypothetical protein
MKESYSKMPKSNGKILSNKRIHGIEEYTISVNVRNSQSKI